MGCGGRHGLVSNWLCVASQRGPEVFTREFLIQRLHGSVARHTATALAQLNAKEKLVMLGVIEHLVRVGHGRVSAGGSMDALCTWWLGAGEGPFG